MTPFDLASRFIGLKELAGGKDNGFIAWAHSLCGDGEQLPDEVPWCSAFLNAICWMLRLPRSKSALARSWLSVGLPIVLAQAKAGHDVVILKRGAEPQPGPENLTAPGHVFLFGSEDGTRIMGVGGNQGDAVTLGSFPITSILGIRRLSGVNA